MSSALVMTPLRLPPPSTGRGLRRERRVERGIETNDIEAKLVGRQERDPADLAQGHALTPRPACRAARSNISSLPVMGVTSRAPLMRRMRRTLPFSREEGAGAHEFQPLLG